MFDLSRKVGLRLAAAAFLASALTLAAHPADARGPHGSYGGGGYHGGGHGYHGGHYHGGFAFGVGIGLWDPFWPGYYGWGYPYYPYYSDYYPDAGVTTIIQQPVTAGAPAAAPPSYYYCDAPAGYYPFVQNCSRPWRPVPVSPPPAQ